MTTAAEAPVAEPFSWRPRWRADASGFVARFAGEWASPSTWDERDELAEIVRQMPNGDQVEIVGEA